MTCAVIEKGDEEAHALAKVKGAQGVMTSLSN